MRINRLYSLDVETHAVRPLRPYPVPAFVGRFTFSGDGRLGMINNGRGLSEQLQWLDAFSLRTLTLPLKRAGTPAWAPEGARVVFDGVPDTTPGTAMDLSVVPRSLYVLDTRTHELRTILSGLMDLRPVGVAWVPNSDWIVIPMKPRGLTEGLWIVDIVSGHKALWRPGVGYGAPAFSPDGKKVAVPVAIDALVPGLKPATKQRPGIAITTFPDDSTIRKALR